MVPIESAITQVLAWVAYHQAILIPLAILIVADLKTSLTSYPKVETFLGILADLLSFHQHSDSPGTLKMIGTRSKKPTIIGQPIPLNPPMAGQASKKTPPAGFTVLALVLLLAAPARADLVLSHGPSIPMLEFTGATHPVSFAPGFGYQLALGVAQFSFLGQQWDALDISAIGFGNALQAPNGDPAGTLQVALALGTLNNLIAIGAAVPLYGAGVGALQGSFHVYPILSLNIPISFEPLQPPVGYSPGPAGLPRGGTIYFGTGPTTAVPTPPAVADDSHRGNPG